MTILISDKVISGSDSKKSEISEETMYCYEKWLMQKDYFLFMKPSHTYNHCNIVGS